MAIAAAAVADNSFAEAEGAEQLRIFAALGAARKEG
jgi:hypothetical protein